MNGKLAARIGAVAFVAVAITMAALELRQPAALPTPEIVTVPDERGDAAATLAYCSEIGLEAAEVDICAEAWAAERRRFLGQVERDASRLNQPSGPVSDPALSLTKDR